MAKALLLRALRDSFGHVVEGLEPENLQLAVWKGEVYLENLSLKKDALDSLDLPLEIKVGKVKSLKISIPWTRLGSEPVRVVIDGIYALAILKKEEQSKNSFDPKKSSSNTQNDFLARRQLREKRRMLRWAAITEDTVDEDSPKGSNAQSKESEEDTGFWSRLASKIVDNLEVEVTNVHIKIQDLGNWTSRHFAFGMSMKRFSGTTCDSEGRVQFVDRTSETLLHRIAKCEDVSLYWDAVDKQLQDRDDEYWLHYLHTSEFGSARSKHSYILKPCSPQVFVTKNDTPTSKDPRWSLQVDLEKIHVALSRKQFEDLTAVQLAAESHIVKMSPNARPMTSVSRNPRAWWRYAIHLTVQDIKKKSRRWFSLSNRLLKRQRYIPLYKRTKNLSWLEPLSENEKEVMKSLEDELDLSDVLAFRATALAELRAEKLKSNPERIKTTQSQQQTSWLRSWLGSNSQQISVQLTPEEKAEIESAIDYLEASQRTRVPETTLNIVIKSTLQNTTFSLSDELGQEILHTSLEGELLVETCVGRSWKAAFNLAHFELCDRCTKDTMFETLIAPKEPQTQDEKHRSVMKVIFEVKPHGKPEDVAIMIHVIPFKIILVPTWIAAVSKFFAVSEETRLGEIASDAFTEWTVSKQDELMEALARRTLISLSVNVEDPVIVCPLSVIRSNQNTETIVLDLGRLKIESDDSRLRLRRDESTLEDVERENLAIDAWTLKSEHVRALIMTADELIVSQREWFRFEDNDSRVLLNDFDLNVRLAICVTPKLMKLAKTRLSISASALKLKAPPSLFRFATQLGQTWSRILDGTSSIEISAPTVSSTSQSSNSSSNESPPLMEIDLDVAALITTLSAEPYQQQLARIEFRNFNLKHTRKSNGDIDNVMSLQSLQIEDLFSKNPAILATSFPENSREHEHMISIKTEYRSDHVNIETNFHQLHVNWNPETISAFKDSYQSERINFTSSNPERLPDIPLVELNTVKRPLIDVPVKFFASLKSFSMAMCKGESGRVLMSCIVCDTAMKLESQNDLLNFKFLLGNFKTSQPQDGNNSFEFFSAVGQERSLICVEYQSPPSPGAEAVVGVDISSARLVYQNQMMLELVDYLSEGVMGAIVTKATDSITARSSQKYKLRLDWSSPIVVFPAESALLTYPKSGFEFICEEIRAITRFDRSEDCWVSIFESTANKLKINGFEGESSLQTELLRNPVVFDCTISLPLVENSTYCVSGNVSSIEIFIPRKQYFLFHQLLRDNLLAEQPQSLKVTTPASTIQTVTYGYDRNDSIPTTFKVSVFFQTASITIAEDVRLSIATFAMRRATLDFIRLHPYDPTSTTLSVEVLDLVDERPEALARCFRHLILIDSSKTNELQQHSFVVRYVSAEALIEIDLYMFVSVVLLDLFWNVLNFITTQQPEKESQNLSLEDGSFPHPLDLKSSTDDQVTPWKGTFRLRQASMFFVCDLSSPSTEAIVLGGDLDLEWRRQLDSSTSSNQTTWQGKIFRFELYRATFPNAVVNATYETSSAALLSIKVGHQITEPAEVSFTHIYESGTLNSKIHSRVVSFKMEQLENFLSITDIQTLYGVYRTMMKGDAIQDAQTKHSRKLHMQVDYYQVGPLAYVWPGTKMDRPPPEAKTRYADLPTAQASRLIRKSMEKKRFTVEFHQDFDIQFLEHEGFVTVGYVAHDSIGAGLIVPGDVLVAINYTPVLTKSVMHVHEIVTEERKQDQATAISFTFHPITCRDPLVLKDALQFESKAVLLHLIDDIDARDLPLAHLSFTKIDAFRNGSNVGHTIVAGANLLLAMHYHDTMSGKWAMLMSPWTANLGIQWHSQGQIEASFDTTNDLQFQLSDVFVRATSDAARRVMNTERLHESGEKSGAFLLRNRTGLPLRYWILSENEDEYQKVFVASDETACFSFPHEKGDGAGTRRNYQKKDSNRIQISIGDEGQWRNLPEIHANIVHRSSVTLEPVTTTSPDQSDLKVSYEVNLEDGRLCLELRSFRRIRNTLNCPIEVLASNTLSKVSHIVKVPPHEMVALPLIVGDASEVRIRPLLVSDNGELSDYHWSEPCYIELASQKGTSQVTCMPSTSNLHKWRPFHSNIRVEVEDEDGATYRFTIYPPVVVQNQLPNSLYCRFVFERKIVGEDIILSKGAHDHVHSLAVAGSSSYISFRLPNSKEWTSMIRIERKRKVASTPLEWKDSDHSVSAGKPLEETTQLTIVDGDGSVVPLSVVQETTEYEGVRFIIYCAIWLVNKTGLPLSYGYGQSKWSTTKVGSSCPENIMMCNAPEDSGGKLQVRVQGSHPSAPFSVSTPDGKSRHVAIPGGPSSPYSFDLAVSVDVAPSELFRTNVVTFAPRYVFLNRLGVLISVRQTWDDMNGSTKTTAAGPSLLKVGPHAKEPFWASSSTKLRPFRLQIRASSEQFKTDWSKPFVLEKLLEGRAVVFVELSILESDQFFRFNMEVREDQLAGSIDVDLSEWIPRTNLPLEDLDPDDDEYVSINDPTLAPWKTNRNLPKTVIKLGIPKVEVILRRDVPPKQTEKKKNLPQTNSSMSPRSKRKTPPPPPPPPPPQTSLSTFSSANKIRVEGKEVSRLTIIGLELLTASRIDQFKEYQLRIRELRVSDPLPGAPFPQPIEGTPIDQKHVFFNLHIIQKGSVYERFHMKLPGFKLKVDERFVLDLARFANEAVLVPLKGASGATFEDEEADCVGPVNDILERRESPTAINTSNQSGSLIFFKNFYISDFEIRLWYHQVKKSNNSTSLVSFGIFSKLNIRIANQKIKFDALPLRKPFGSYNLYAGLIKEHYETQARSQIGTLLFSSIDFTSAPSAVVDTFLKKFLGTEVKSTEFRGESLSDEDIVTRYRRRLLMCKSLDSFVRDVVRNCVFDWTYNHTGLLYSRHALICGIINRSQKDITVQCILSRGSTFNILPGGLAARQIGSDSVKIVPGSKEWDSSTTCLVLANGFSYDTVDLTVKSTGFTARFNHVECIMKSHPGFTAAFLAKDVSKWLSWYVIIIDNQLAM